MRKRRKNGEGTEMERGEKKENGKNRKIREREEIK